MATVINDPGLNYGIGQSFGNLLGGLGVGYLENRQRGQEKASMLDYLQQTGVPQQQAQAFINTPPQFQEQAWKDMQRSRSMSRLSNLSPYSMGAQQPGMQQPMQPGQMNMSQTQTQQAMQPQQFSSDQLRASKGQALAKAQQDGADREDLKLLGDWYDSEIKASQAKEDQQLKMAEPQRKAEVAEYNTFRKDLKGRKKIAENNETIRKLIRSGGVTTGGWKRLTSMLGAGFENIPNGDLTQLADKMLTQNLFLAASGQATPGRQTPSLIALEMKANPTLYNTPDAIEAMFDQQLWILKEDEAIEDEAERIKKANGGIQPLGLYDMARQAAEPKLQELKAEYGKKVDSLIMKGKPGINTNELPAANQVPNKIIFDDSTGTFMLSNGQTYQSFKSEAEARAAQAQMKGS